MKIFTLISLSLLLITTACDKKKEASIEDVKIEQQEIKTETKINAELKNKIVEKKTAEATIKVKKRKKKMDMTNIMKIKLKTGTVTIKLRPDLAPKHVERIKTLSQKGFYNGLKFHRVIDGFMAQTGDPKGDGTGGSDLPNVESEFSSKSFERGVLGMARSASPHSANSQFFIMLAPATHLNNAYTVFGEVTDGMEHVDKIKMGAGPNGAVTAPADTMIEVTVGS